MNSLCVDVKNWRSSAFTVFTRNSWVKLSSTVLTSSILLGCSFPTSTRQNAAKPPIGPEAFFPDALPDPLEPLNRGVFAINKAIFLSVLQPTSRVYQRFMPSSVRHSIKNVSRNVTYPGRVINHALQARWNGAGDESLRFLTNTTIGIGGLFDVASAWKIPKSEAHFAQTFSLWGWQPRNYLMLPMLGPSDETHALGMAADELATPWNYQFPYRYASYVSNYDRISDTAGPIAQFLRSESDPYVGVKYLWTYSSKESSPDWRPSSAIDIPTLETLGVAAIRAKDPTFIDKAKSLNVRMSSTGRDMKFSYWLRSGKAPLVYLAPGLGSHRLASPTLSLAEVLFQNGFSVVATTGLFHKEFMENASTSALPAYPPNDCRDLLAALTDCDRLLERKHPAAFSQKALVGFSMGGYEALHLAANEQQQSDGLLHFSRYVAINPPVDLRYGVKAIDSFRDAPLAWSAQTRQARINNSIHKVAQIATAPAKFAQLPVFDATESKFLIGSSFELTLRDTIYDTQKRHPLGVLSTPITPWKREDSYREISTYAFRDYFLRMVVPYYQTRGIDLKDFARETNLRSYEKALQAHPKVRVVTNRNDFLMTPSDVSWLESTLGSSRLTLFSSGGHLGNMASAPVQKALIKSLQGMK
jgi:ABC-type transporter lipoprotein component MlaA/pimeloyl-ACP methyl ester carboxylesterase